MSGRLIQDLCADDAALRALIGRRVRYLGTVCEIIDVLLDEDLLILAAEEGTELQEDSYGRAHRKVPRHLSLRFRDTQGKPTHLWEDLVFLDGPPLGTS